MLIQDLTQDNEIKKQLNTSNNKSFNILRQKIKKHNINY